MSEERAQFRAFIRDGLAKHPEWLRDALEAISGGMEEALRESNEQRASYDLAFRSALILAGKERVSAETKDILNRAIIKAIDPRHASPCEREFLEGQEPTSPPSL